VFARQAIEWLWNLGKPSSPLPVLVLGAAVMFCIQLYRDITDVDIFWQVKLGELTLAGGLPEHEPFLAGKGHEPLAAVAWLSQAVYAAVRLAGGWPLLHLFDAAIWFGGFFVVAWQSAGRFRNDWPALAGLFLGWYTAILHASMRPQSCAVLCFGLLIVLLRSEWSAKRKLLLGSLLLVLWQNLHPSVIIGIGYLGCSAIVEWMKIFFYGSRGSPPWERGTVTPTGVNPVARRSAWNCTLLTTIAIVATVLTPAGSGIFAISKYNQEISKERGITEWQPMWVYPREYGRENAWVAFYLFLHVLIFVVASRLMTGRWRVRAADVAVVFGLTAASLIMHRFVLFWAVAVIPVVAEAFAFPSRWSPPPNRWRRPIALLAALFAVLPPMIQKPAPFCDYYPFEATRHLKNSGFKGVIYSDYFWGGMLAEAGYPDWKVTHDGRYYLFTRDEWKLYDNAMAGRVPLDELLERHDPDAFFLRKWEDEDYPHDEGLIRRLRSRWRVIFEDRQSIVFVRE
jgi:hypothetical protein